MSGLHAGAVRLNMTPPPGIRMAGYASRDHGAEGVRDELWLRAVHLACGEVEAAIVSLDLCIVSFDWCQALRERITAELDLPAAHVWLHTTHTHSGPVANGEGVEARYLAALEDKVLAALTWARAQSRPVTLSRGRAPLQIGVNRRERRPDGTIVLGVNHDGSVIPHLDVIRLAGEDGEPVATLFSHACHPTTLGGDNYLLSSEWPGAAAAMVEAELGGVAPLLQGCSADINPYPRGSFAHVDLLGRRVGHAVLQLCTELPEGRPVTRLQAAERQFDLPLDLADAPADLASARQRLADAEAALAEAVVRKERGESVMLFWLERDVRGAQTLVEAFEAGGPPRGVPFHAQQLALDDVALVALPTEIFSTIGKAVEAGSPYPHTLVAAYTNGWNGYLPDAVVWDEGGYEFSARIRHAGLPIASNAAQVCIAETLALVRTDGAP